MKAAVYGTVAGILFGLSAALTKPTLEFLHEASTSCSRTGSRRARVAGVLGFVLQQVSLGTGRLAPSVATVSVANPVVGILLGLILLDERLSRPAWHIVVAVAGCSSPWRAPSSSRSRGSPAARPTRRRARCPGTATA